MARSTTVVRLDAAYGAFVEANQVPPSVRQLREAAGVGQQAVVEYLRQRREAEQVASVPQLPQEVLDTMTSVMWPAAWKLASKNTSDESAAALEKLMSAHADAEDRAVAAEAKAVAAEANAVESREALQEAAKSQSQAEGRAAVLAEQVASLQAEMSALRKQISDAQARATAAEGVAAGLREALGRLDPAEKS